MWELIISPNVFISVLFIYLFFTFPYAFLFTLRYSFICTFPYTVLFTCPCAFIFTFLYAVLFTFPCAFLYAYIPNSVNEGAVFESASCGQLFAYWLIDIRVYRSSRSALLPHKWIPRVRSSLRHCAESLS